MKKNKQSKKEKKILENKFLQVILCLLIAVIIYFILVVITNSNSFQSKILNSNTNSMFTITDLSIKNSKYGDLISAVETEFGTPTKIEEFTDNDINYKTYFYKGAELTFKEVNKSYILMKAKVTEKGYIVSRNLQIGDDINDVMNKFLIINTKGDYLYGNYTENDLNGKKVKENVYYGKREKNMIYYLYMEAPYENTYASFKETMATLSIKVSMNKVKEIEWMYGPVEE